MSSKCLIGLLLIVSLAIGESFAPGRMIVKFQPNLRDKIITDVRYGHILLESDSDGVQTNISVINQLNQKWQVSKIEKLIQDLHPNELAKQFGLDLLYCFCFPEDKNVMSVIRDYEQSGVFEYAEPDFIYQTDKLTSITPHLSLSPDFLRRTPNDPYYTSQWHLEKMQCPLAWDTILGNSSVTMAVVDLGVNYLHEDLASTYAGGYDFSDGDTIPLPIPADYFGTWYAGCATAHTNNNLGIAGISWGSRYLAYRCGTNGAIYSGMAISAIHNAVSRNAWTIIFGFGGSTFSSSFNDVVQYAWQSGCVLIATSGNYSSGQVRYPAGYNNVIAVTASNQNDYLVTGTNYANWIDVVAPGYNIFTTTNAGYENGYQTMPIACVAGQAMLLKSMYPTITNAQCTTRIFESCDSMPDPLYAQGMLGRGRINVAKAIYQPIKCNLKTVSFRINDGNNNIPQAGEVFSIITTMQNDQYFQNATNVSGVITCDDSSITIVKNTATFPPIINGTLQNCSADSFILSVNPNTNPHQARFIIEKLATPSSMSRYDTIYINIGLGIIEEQFINTIYPTFDAKPNPFHNLTTIHYSLSINSLITLEIYDVSGKLVKSLVTGLKPQGEYMVMWDGTNDIGEKVKSGVYFYTLKTQNKTLTGKIIKI